MQKASFERTMVDLEEVKLIDHKARGRELDSFHTHTVVKEDWDLGHKPTVHRETVGLAGTDHTPEYRRYSVRT